MNRAKVKSVLFPLVLPALIFSLWIFVTETGRVPALILPSLMDVIHETGNQFINGTLIEDMTVSLSRIIRGYSLAVLAGGGLGVLMGMSVRAEKFFAFTFTSIRQIPMISWVPLLVIWFGIGENSKIAVIFIAAYFPVLMNTMSGIRRCDYRLLEVGRMYKLSKWEMFRKIYLPSALPSIFVGLKLGLGIAWMAVVGAEMIAAASGIGFRISDARALMQFPVVFSGMFAIAVTGLIMDRILTAISKLAIRWERKENG